MTFGLLNLSEAVPIRAIPKSNESRWSGGFFMLRRRTYEMRDGFFLKQERFDLPKDLTSFSRQDLFSVSVCHLFLNRKFTMFMIGKASGQPHSSVVRTLLSCQVIEDRRLLQGYGPQGRERRLWGS